MKHRRNFTMPLLFAWAFALAWCNNSPISQQRKDILSITSEDSIRVLVDDSLFYNDYINFQISSFSIRQKKIIDQAFGDYWKFFGCAPKKITFQVWTIELDNRARPNWTAQVEAYSLADTIYLPQKNYTAKQLRDITLHELSHINRPNKWSSLSKPLLIPSWGNIVWYHGLCVFIENWDKQFIEVIFEEAVADLLAMNIDPHYSVENIWYSNVTMLLNKFIHHWWITIDDLKIGLQHNNTPNVFDKIFWSNASWVEIETLLSSFQQLMMNKCSVDQAFDWISVYRK